MDLPLFIHHIVRAGLYGIIDAGFTSSVKLDRRLDNLALPTTDKTYRIRVPTTLHPRDYLPIKTSFHCATNLFSCCAGDVTRWNAKKKLFPCSTLSTRRKGMRN